MKRSDARTRQKYTGLKKTAWSFHSGTCAYIGSDDKIHFIGTFEGNPEKSVISYTENATEISWSLASDTLAAGFEDGQVGIWSNGTTIFSDEFGMESVALISWHPGKNKFATASTTGTIRIWNIDNNKIKLQSSKPTAYKFLSITYTFEDQDTIYAMNDEGELLKYVEKQELEIVTSLPRPINYINLSYDGKIVYSLSGDNILTIYTTSPKFKKLSQSKLASGESICFSHISDDKFCYCCNDTMYIIDNNCQILLTLKPNEKDNIIGTMFYSDTCELACMTGGGRLMLWKYEEDKNALSIVRSLETTTNAKKIIWSPYTKEALIVLPDGSFSPCQIPPIRCVVSKDITAVQTDARSISLTGAFRQKFDFIIEKMSASANNLLILSKTTAYMHSMGYGSLTQISQFPIPGTNIEILGDTVYAVNGQTLEVHNKQGETRVSVPIDAKGTIIRTSINGRFLCLLSDLEEVVLFDVSKRNPEYKSTSKLDIPEPHHRIRSISISRGGYCLSVSIDVMDRGRWKLGNNIYLHSPKLQKTVSMQPEGGIPLVHLWDTVSERLLCIQTPSFVIPAFISTDLNVMMMKSRPSSQTRLMFKVEVPRIYTCVIGTRSQVSTENSVNTLLIPQLVDVDGLEGQTRRILTNIYYCIFTGDKAGAETIVSAIKEESVARSAMKFCINNGEKGLADICSKVLTSAVEVKSGDKLDFLNNITSTSFDEAASICTPTDKLPIRAASYLRGSMFELEGNEQESIKSFAQSGPNGSDILRMAMHKGDLSIIFKAANDGNSDPQLHLWLGRYYEYKTQFETALTHYDLCGEIRESLRVLCITKQWQEASRHVSNTGDRGAICRLARLMIKKLPTVSGEEQESMKKDILNLFKNAHQNSAAFEFAFEQGMENQILSLSLSAPATLLAKAAKKYEEDKNIRTAVLLWHRAGRVNKAISLCLENQLVGALTEIADTITDKSDHEVLENAANFFVSREDWTRAAYFLALAHNFTFASKICNDHDVQLPQSLMEELSQTEDELEAKQVALLCEQLQMYNIASKVWMRLNDHISAMKDIIRGDDPEKVIRFANKLKRKDAFIMAADYLSEQNPREGEQLFITAMQFYQRAGSYDKISQFLERSAQTEIDDFQDYKKALDLLRRAHQTMAKTDMTRDREAIVMSQLQKIRWIEMYIEASECVQSDPMRMQCICNELLQTRGVDICLRLEDVYMLLVQYFVELGNFTQAQRILENMRKNGVDLKWFMEVEQLKKIYRMAGVEYVDEEPTFDRSRVDNIPDDCVDPIEDDF
ncbi:hypothetical protein TVAG_083840 [Trichomonas vaginalis G3]|uniref:Uncharacterized protein n=1 Tax=Trichomonas vaginalis (strain ATCC PRA-98 / G3) TaxID=412133 RepID=A2DMA8_TRIV3|nr:ift140/172-related cilium protein family [Trichomonas vaginalis G3]EAY18528.1 hypothetical protein TVAG_083840 [Trichomonas vaginalis G3]KAI5489482.1 ift140/172-related cilium protein family [Trichomonas vaginalis G3]|eukprot:XP_001579514.1 hypothetical protein [Trichomonas vaginalis G3]